MLESQSHRNLIPRLAAGELSKSEGREAVRHLLAGCGSCSRALSDWTRGSRWSSRANGADAVGFRRALARARATAAAATSPPSIADLLGELEALDLGAAREQVRAQRRFASIELCERLAAMSFSSRETEPATAARLAELAVSVAAELDPADRRAADAGARAWNSIANLRWRAGDLVAAERAIQNLDEHLARGTGDPYLLATREELFAATRMSAGQFDEALGAARRASALYRRVGDPHGAAQAMVCVGACLGLDGRTDEAIRTLRRAISQLEPGRDPRMELGARHNLALMLLESGRADEAAAQLVAIRPLYPRLGSAQHVLDSQWLEGKILAAQGETAAAEAALLAARDGFVALPNPLDSAFVTLELATLYLEQGRTREVRTLATTLLAFFRSHRVEREALAAVILFAEAAQSDRLTVELVLQITTAIERARTAAH